MSNTLGMTNINSSEMRNNLWNGNWKAEVFLYRIIDVEWRLYPKQNLSVQYLNKFLTTFLKLVEFSDKDFIFI